MAAGAGHARIRSVHRRAARGLGKFGVRAGEMCSSGIEVGEAGRRAVRYKKGDVMGARRGMCACLEGVGEAAMVVRQGYGNVRRPRLLAFRVLMSG
jgi:hypothetical protein